MVLNFNLKIPDWLLLQGKDPDNEQIRSLMTTGGKTMKKAP